MSSPPLKRQRHLVATRQNNQDELERASENNQGNLGLSFIKSCPRLAKQSEPSAKKNVGRTKPTLEHTFFNSKTRSQTQAKLSAQATRTESIQDETLDIVDDDFNDKVFVQADRAADNPPTRKIGDFSMDDGNSFSSRKTMSTSRTLTKPLQKPELPSTRAELNYKRPWIDLYPPSKVEELCVHNRKIEEVDRWLETSMERHTYRRMLIIKGPAGCAKTTTLKLLLKKRGINAVEWSNPVQVDFGHNDYVSLSAQFSDFVNRSAHFSSLKLREASSDPLAAEESGTKKAVIVIDDFPMSVQSSNIALACVREALLLHLQTESLVPMIMIFSEQESSMSSGSDGLNIRRILGPDVMEHPTLAVIEFNKVAPTFIMRALEIILDKHIAASGHRYAATFSILRTLGNTGDIRNAINNLQILCTGSTGLLTTRTDATERRAFKSANKSSSSADKTSTQELFHRDDRNGLFHSIGKVVYNKRDGNNIVQPPVYFPQNHRPFKSSVDVDAVIQHLEVSNEIYLLALHENYISSCESSNFLDLLEKASANLSDADVLGGKTGNNRPNRILQTNEATDFVRQEEISLQAAIRGLLFSLPYPVKRLMSHSGKAKRQITYPTFARLKYQQNEMRNYMQDWLGSAIARGAGKGADNLLNHEQRKYLELKESFRLPHSTLGCPLPMTRIMGDSLVLYDMPYNAMMRRQDGHFKTTEPLLKVVHFPSVMAGKVAQNLLDIAPAFTPSRTLDEPLSGNGPGGIPRLYLSEDDIEDE